MLCDHSVEFLSRYLFDFLSDLIMYVPSSKGPINKIRKIKNKIGQAIFPDRFIRSNKAHKSYSEYQNI